MPEISAQADQEEWLRVRRYLNQNRLKLTQSAAELYPSNLRVRSTTFLSTSNWISTKPIPLETIRLIWDPDATTAEINGMETVTEKVRPWKTSNERYITYSDALENLAPPRLLENRKTYRLVGVNYPEMNFSQGSYFDVINISEAVAHEFAAAHIKGEGIELQNLPLRSAIANPFDLHRRPLSVGISTLTLRADQTTNSGTFILHWRNPQRVASGGGFHQVMPVGVFQPSTDAPLDQKNDFHIWRNLVREYSEEFLGEAERQGKEGQAIKYEEWPFYHAMTEAWTSKSLRVHFFGAGIDPLTLVADILLVAVFDADAYDNLLGGMVSENEEGLVVAFSGTTQHNLPFTKESIEEFLEDKPMQPAGAAVLELALENRQILLAPPRQVRGITTKRDGRGISI